MKDTSSTSDNKENENQQRNGSIPPPSPAPTEQNKKHSIHKQEKAILHEFEGHAKEVKAQLTEQLKVLGERTETQVAVLQEMEDYYKRRGELEAEHAKQLDKLAKSIMQRHKAEKNRRDAWTQHTACTTWQQMVDDAKEEAAQKQTLADLYQKVFTASISSRCDDLVRLSKRCREVGVGVHSEINRVLTELHTAMKTYQLCHSELNGVEKKYRVADDDKRRYEEANPGKFETARKYKNICKYRSRRGEKYELVRWKCTKARNEYLMCVTAANTALHRFFAVDLSYLIDCMDLGMDSWMKALLEQEIEARKRVTTREMNSLAELGTLRSSFDSKADKQRFFEAHHAIFMLPKQFEFRPQLGDSIATVSAEKSLGIELGIRQKQIEVRLDGLRFESDEVWKSLEASERQLHQLYTEPQEDMGKWRSDVLVTYQYYLKKFEYFLLNGNLIERLAARSRSITEAVARENGQQHRDSIISCEDRTRRKAKRIGQAPDLSKPRPKLFGGSLDEYVEISHEPIPLVVTSAIGYLSRFSLRNQGLFRVSGSQSEINRFKDAYEKGEDAFSELIDGSETNSVAGALKLYLRELREPLFPIFLFDQFVDCAKAEAPGEFIRRANELIYKLPISHILLLRFLFGFLSHLCEFADENMMEPHNLAICFGPTLLPIPEGKDQVVYHNYVNELVRNLIIHSAEVFPAELDGPIYDKFAIDTEPEHIGYMDDGDILSDDEEAPGTRNGIVGTSSGDQMLDSTYDMSVSTENEGPVIPRETTHSTIQQPMSPRMESQPSISSRSSNRSAIDEYLRRMSEETSPILKTDMPHRIANELNAKFAARESRDFEKQQKPTISPPRPIWEQDRPASHTSILSQTSNASSSRVRIPVVTSLRDQLHHVRREFNGRDDGKVYPISDTLPSSKRLSLHEGGVLDARGTLPREQSETRSQICDYTSRLATTTAGSLRDELNSMFNEHLSHQQSSLSDAPDVVMSARRFASEAHTRSISPQLDELAAMLKATSVE